MLGPDGTTQAGNFQYDVTSFRQVTQVLAPGLSTLLPDLAGAVRRQGLTDTHVDVTQARRIFNDLIVLRFSLLRNFRLLRNERLGTIDGLVSHTHRRLENAELLDIVEEVIGEAPRRTVFHGGAVVGRRCVLWYRAATPMFVFPVDGRPHSFYCGYYFHNGEATGHSVRCSLTVFTRYGTCLAPFTKTNRIKHSGRDFHLRLGKMLASTVVQEIPYAVLQEGVQNLMATPLGFETGPNHDQKAVAKRIVRNLRNLGMPMNWAQSCLDETLLVGRTQQRPDRPVPRLDELYASRTFFDLFASCVRMARQLPTSRRETVEHVAYRLLTDQSI
jgi:hypothetical protein